MLNRTNYLLIAILVLQFIFGGVMVYNANSRPASPEGPLLKDFNSDAVKDITIEDSSKSLHFVLKDDQWVLPDYDNFPVKDGAMQTILDKIAGLQANRLIASNPTSYARLKVKEDDFNRRVTVKQGDQSTAIYFGTNGGASTTYTRVDGDSNVYLTSGLATYDIQANVSNWIDTNYSQVNSDDVTQFIITNVSGTFEFNRDAGGNWTYAGLQEGETLDQSKFNTPFRNATSIRMSAPLGLTEKPEYGMDTPSVVIEIKAMVPVTPPADATPVPTPADDSSGDTTAPVEKVERDFTLTIGTKQANNNYVIKSSENDYYVEIREPFVSSFLNLTHEGLLVVPETDTATPTPTGS